MTTNYTASNTLKIAKRYKNSKRSYLLVNPLQAKHIPVSPSASLTMMQCLGLQVACKYPDTRLVIGFAETATAIGAVVASCFEKECMYIHTTREILPEEKNWIIFSEEHSHAVEQRIYTDGILNCLSQTSTIIFVDDELSTGKTLINMIQQLQTRFPILQSINLVAASIFNRLTNENMAQLASFGVSCEYLIKLPDTDYSELVSHIQTMPARNLMQSPLHSYQYMNFYLKEPLMNPRILVNANCYVQHCQQISEEVIPLLPLKLPKNANLLVLGTEECMFPALILGELLEKQVEGISVFCHATTRSPIGICQKNDYPIQEGYKLPSFYDRNRETYLYNLTPYDVVIVVSDTSIENAQTLFCLSEALSVHGYEKLFYLGGDCHV